MGEIDGDLVVVVYEKLCRGRFDKLPILEYLLK